jgi:hypothetical protein
MNGGIWRDCGGNVPKRRDSRFRVYPPVPPQTRFECSVKRKYLNRDSDGIVLASA